MRSGLATAGRFGCIRQPARAALLGKSSGVGVGLVCLGPNTQARFQQGMSSRIAAGSYWSAADDVPGVTSYERHQDNIDLLGFQIRPDSTLVDLWDQAVRCWPERRFVGSKMWVRGRLGYVWATYESLNEEVNAARHMLNYMGVGKGNRVAIITENRYEWIAIHFATLQLGAQFVNIPTNTTPGEARHIVAATESMVLFVESPASYHAVKDWIMQEPTQQLKHILCFEEENGVASYAQGIAVAAASYRHTKARADAPSVELDRILNPEDERVTTKEVGDVRDPDTGLKATPFSESEKSKDKNAGLETFREPGDPVPGEERDRRGTIKATPIRTDIEMDDIAMIVFTAGTTGPPKGCILSHRCMVANISSVYGQLGESITHEDLYLSLCPWSVAGAITTEIYQILAKGAAMCIPPDLMEGFEDITTVNPTVVSSVGLPFNRAFNNITDDISNRVWTQNVTRSALGDLAQSRQMQQKPSLVTRALSETLLSKFKRQFGTQLRLVIILGQPVPFDQAELFADLDIYMVNVYSCQEAGGVIATDIDVAGKPRCLPGVDVRIVNENNEVVVPGDTGEILVEAPHCMNGYFDTTQYMKAAEDNEKALVRFGSRQFVRTGDFGSLTGGWLKIKGNKDALITLEDGKVIDPYEVEAVTQTSPFIKQCFIVGEGKPYVTALIVPLSLAISNHLKRTERRDGVPMVNEREKAECVRFELRRVSKKLQPRAHIRRFAFVDEFTLQNGFMTVKHTYARQKVEDHYVAYINALYEDGPKFFGHSVDDYDDLF